MLRAHILILDDPDPSFIVEDSTLPLFYSKLDAELEKRGRRMSPYTLTWLPEHFPQRHDDVHRWLESWRTNSKPTSDQNQLLQRMLAEYLSFAEDGKSLRP